MSADTSVTFHFEKGELAMSGNYKDFLSMVESKVADQMGGGYNVSIQSMKKNNGVMLDSIVIRRVDELICPNIYLRHFYEQYENGTDIEEICDEIIAGYKDAIPSAPIDPEALISPESVREHVVYRLINYEKNSLMLRDIPHKQFLDLALIYYVMVHAGEIGDGAILVNKNVLEYCEMTLDEMDLAASRNTRKLLPADFMKITDLLREFGEKAGAQSYSDIDLEEDSSCMPLYVLTNKERQFGAYYMTDMEILTRISEKLKGDLYILPSSVHECMIVPAQCWDEPQSLAAMVHDINMNQVSDEEYLADTVYLFDSEESHLSIAA